MGTLYVARRPGRRGLIVPREGTRAHPTLIFPLDGVDRGELDDLIRAILAKGGVTNESEVQTIIDAAELDSEVRIKVDEAKAEVRRLMRLRAQGLRLMQVGYRKWREAFYPAVKQLK